MGGWKGIGTAMQFHCLAKVLPGPQIYAVSNKADFWGAKKTAVQVSSLILPASIHKVPNISTWSSRRIMLYSTSGTSSYQIEMQIDRDGQGMYII